MTADRLPRDRDVWRIAAPMILSNVSVPLLGLVDTGVVGHLDSEVYIGAVAIGGTMPVSPTPRTPYGCAGLGTSTMMVSIMGRSNEVGMR